ncbi:MAG: RsmD family RNA methyltransferase [Cellulophaga sp.]
MRIISGIFKSKRITAPKKLPVRPTTDMAKEALFNILNNSYYFDEISVLDLFAGTGNISYEFGSRGCKQLTCVDANYGCIKFISKTSEELELNISAIKSDVFSFLEKTSLKSNIIFADPPYAISLEDFSKIPALVFKNDLLSDGGVLIIEHAKETDLSNLMHYSKQKKYGSSIFSFFEKE